ncbi:MAG: hypothetical protein NXI24_17060 [bacterium]|nr:hypothetical protein [bacterium]
MNPIRNSGRLSLSLTIFFAIGFANSIGAHHPPTNPGGRVLGDSTTAPRDQVVLSLDYLKGDRENRDVWTANAAGELVFFEGRLGLGLQIPYQYFEQRDRDDAARFSRPRLGLRLQPWPELEAGGGSFYLIGDLDLGFATGSDRGRFVDENFYDSNAGLTLGYAIEGWIFTLRGGGIFPLTRLPKAEVADTPGITRLPWEPVEETNTRDTHELKKVSEWRLRAGYRITESFLGFAGFLYRRPYAGVIKERATGDDVPQIYREVEAGIVYQLSDSVSITGTYRQPLFRKRENSGVDEVWYLLQGRTPPNSARHKLYTESYTVAVSFLF